MSWVALSVLRNGTKSSLMFVGYKADDDGSWAVTALSPDMTSIIYSPQDWPAILLQDPQRVVHALSPRRHRCRPSWVFPVLRALQKLEPVIDTQILERLIDFGLIEELCGAALWDHVPSLQEEPDQEAAIYAIQILTSIIVDFMHAGDNDSRNLIVGHRRRRLITAISSKWGAVMKRLWNAQHLNHTEGGRIASCLLNFILPTDASVLRSVDRHDDMTLSILSRSLMQTSSPREFATLARLVHNIHYPPTSMDRIVRYRIAHAPPNHMNTSILRGVPDNSPELFLDSITARLSQCEVSDFDDIFSLVPMLVNVGFYGWRSFLGAVCRSTALFTSASSRILELPLIENPNLAHTIDPILKMSSIVALCASLSEIGLEHREHLVGAFAESMFLEALEYALSPQLASPLTLEHVQLIFTGLFIILEETPSLVPVFRQQLPRPKLLRRCLDLTFAINRASPYYFPDEYRPIEKDSWLILQQLVEMCQKPRQCMRRGCTRTRRKRCKDCRSVQYCGESCQKEDWHEHRVICGFSIVEGSDERPGSFPLRFGSGPC